MCPASCRCSLEWRADDLQPLLEPQVWKERVNRRGCLASLLSVFLEGEPPLPTHRNSTQSFSIMGTCWEALWLLGPSLPHGAPLPFKSGHSSPASLFLATLSWVQMPTAEATEGCDGKSRRGGRWQGGQQSCLVSRSNIPDTFCLEKWVSPESADWWRRGVFFPCYWLPHSKWTNSVM